MRKNKQRFPVTLLFIFLALFTASCSKSSVDSTDVLGNWKRSSEFEGVGRTEAVSFTIGNTLYIGLGYDGSNRLVDFWQFDQTTGTWLRRADFPGTARNSAVAFAVDGKGYVGTGYDGVNKLTDFWQYDPATNTWSQVAGFGGTGRYGAVGFSLGNKGYVCSGYDGNYLKDLWEYDPSGNTWTQRASLTGSKRTDAVAFVYDNKAYVVSGVNNGSYLNDFWVYDATTNTWAEKRKITNASDDEYDDDYSDYITRSNGSAFIINSKAYLVCGYRSGVINTTYEYDFANDTWIQKTAFEGPAREGAIGFAINNRGYLTTGSNSSQRFDDLWEFFPDAEQTSSDN